jgi:hypothetical protein
MRKIEKAAPAADATALEGPLGSGVGAGAGAGGILELTGAPARWLLPVVASVERDSMAVPP